MFPFEGIVARVFFDVGRAGSRHVARIVLFQG